MNPTLAAAKSRQVKNAASNAKIKRKLIGGDGSLSGGLDPVLYHNAIRNGESWEDKGFRNDMARRHPELNLHNGSSGKIMVGSTGEGGTARNRHGRVSKRFVNGQWFDAQTGAPLPPDPDQKPLFG